jgi:hypothetical protein
MSRGIGLAVVERAFRLRNRIGRLIAPLLGY